ncbi:MAG TPA: isoprenylcysteine carboxylmethyltransferase family protein [Hyphomonadaceae bacterium]|nr:isoprenylcysteine carboxylmethyltransferase family protein [Hyphomonadaceae bacterium]
MHWSLALRTAYGLSALFALSWTVAAVWASRAAAQPAQGSQILYRLLTIAGMVMVLGWWRLPALQLWVLSEPLQWLMVALVAAGFAFCWWARLHLGRLWSGSITRKEGHRIVDTGPYRFVRHPIYTGLILAPFSLAALKGDAMTFAGAAVLTLAWWIKARLEERFLRQELGPEAYDAYAARTPMLIPFWPR